MAKSHDLEAVVYVDLDDYCRRNPHLKKLFVAATLEVSSSRFSRLKSGTSRPTPDEARRIAALLGRPVEYVVELYTPAA